jgi:DNA-directed RNA polymerase subunit RPC12/RpoP
VALKDLRRAHTLMERGEHANAAVLFERQAREAGDRGLYLPAAHLFLQAGRARLLAGESAAGEGHLRQGLEILANIGDHRRMSRSGSLLVKDLVRMAQDRLAEEVRMFVKQALEKLPAAAVAPESAPAHVPYKCMQCGAILRAEDIEPGDSGSPVCVYCGSLANP